MGHDDRTQRTITATNKRTEAFCIKTKNVIIKKKKKTIFKVYVQIMKLFYIQCNMYGWKRYMPGTLHC